MLNLFLAPTRVGRNAALQRLSVETNPSTGGIGILIKKIKAEMTQSNPLHHRQGFNTCLCRTVKQGVAAAEIRLEGMIHPAAVAQVNGVQLTRSAAVGVVMPVRQQRAKQAVLHVKQRHVLMQHHLQAIAG